MLTILEQKKGFNLNMVIGLDGFVDEIIHVVDKRQDFENYTVLPSIGALGDRISSAAGLSANIEMVPVQVKLGGNGPILSNALLEFGVGLTYFGALGKGEVHEVFRPMAGKAQAVHNLCDPGLTLALEFTDGKIMLGKHTSLKDLTWDVCKAGLGGAAGIAAMVAGADLFGMENWTMMPHMSSIWEGMIAEVFPLLPGRAEKPLAFFDLADPEKRTKEDIRHAMGLISKFEQKFRSILGLNEREAFGIADVLGVPHGGSLQAATMGVYEKMGIYCLVVHPVKSACCAIGGQFYHMDGPYCPAPKLTTGAGDNFNAGFCLAQGLGLSPEDSLALGVCTSGFYVRNAKSPSFQEVIDFAGKWSRGELEGR
ncbi:MAG: carbohydrate kinase family protein [Defluviitaleaceae bacterium]|nr:carbohydrate kinase family protein [Defluviitaleaceae bacterium]